jgi:hypothetical protein
MTCRSQLTGFFVLLFAALAFILTARTAGGLVWRGQIAIGSAPIADVMSPS